MRTVLRRFQQPFLETVQKRIPDGLTNAWFLCRVGKRYFASQMHFIKMESLEKQGKSEKANTTIGYLYVFDGLHDADFGLQELDELMELKTQG